MAFISSAFFCAYLCNFIASKTQTARISVESLMLPQPVSMACPGWLCTADGCALRHVRLAPKLYSLGSARPSNTNTSSTMSHFVQLVVTCPATFNLKKGRKEGRNSANSSTKQGCRFFRFGCPCVLFFALVVAEFRFIPSPLWGKVLVAHLRWLIPILRRRTVD